MAVKEKPATKTIATNREARHEYFVMEALETGIELKGTEVKSLRAGGVNLKDSWVDIDGGELIVKGMHITPYDHGNIFNAPGPQKRDPPPGPAVQAAGLHPGAPLALLQARAGQDGAGAVQRQKALRQAGRRGQAGRQAFHRPGPEIQRTLLLRSPSHTGQSCPFAHLPRAFRGAFHGGVKVSTGGARPGQRVAAGDLL